MMTTTPDNVPSSDNRSDNGISTSTSLVSSTLSLQEELDSWCTTLMSKTDDLNVNLRGVLRVQESILQHTASTSQNISVLAETTKQNTIALGNLAQKTDMILHLLQSGGNSRLLVKTETKSERDGLLEAILTVDSNTGVLPYFFLAPEEIPELLNGQERIVVISLRHVLAAQFAIRKETTDLDVKEIDNRIENLYTYLNTIFEVSLLQTCREQTVWKSMMRLFRQKYSHVNLGTGNFSTYKGVKQFLYFTTEERLRNVYLENETLLLQHIDTALYTKHLNSMGVIEKHDTAIDLEAVFGGNIAVTEYNYLVCKWFADRLRRVHAARLPVTEPEVYDIMTIDDLKHMFEVPEYEPNLNEEEAKQVSFDLNLESVHFTTENLELTGPIAKRRRTGDVELYPNLEQLTTTLTPPALPLANPLGEDLID